ncbi:MAG: CoA pyrophosphatase [Candidatus Saccharicenans sp.]|jgi:8-oxo-dGTP pyrophosphatase MutT (NUDIX family)|nr:CoA pyrophosphatase [Candidatus Saccharicenans sp.]
MNREENILNSIFDLERYLKERLQRPLPGLSSQLKMSVKPLSTFINDKGKNRPAWPASVLVLFYPHQEEIYLVLIKRSGQVRHHQHQISFPGGQQEENESLEQAAIREAEEEINVDPARVKLVGRLTPFYIEISNYCLYPMVAITDLRPDFRPNSQEVAEIIELPLAHLLNSKNRKEERQWRRGQTVLVPFFEFNGYKIWGATAMVLAELIDLLSEKEKPAGLADHRNLT